MKPNGVAMLTEYIRSVMEDARTSRPLTKTSLGQITRATRDALATFSPKDQRRIHVRLIAALNAIDLGLAKQRARRTEPERAR